MATTPCLTSPCDASPRQVSQAICHASYSKFFCIPSLPLVIKTTLIPAELRAYLPPNFFNSCDLSSLAASHSRFVIHIGSLFAMISASTAPPWYTMCFL